MEMSPRQSHEREMSGLLLSETHSGLPGHLGGVRLIEQSTDRRLFLCADLDRGITLWKSRSLVSRFTFPSDGTKAKAMDRIHAIAFSEDARTIYVAAGLHVRCIAVATWEEQWSYRPDNVFGFLQSSPRALIVMKDRSVFVSSDNGQIRVFGPGGEVRAGWRSSDAPLFADLHKEGNLLIGSDGATLTVWDPADRRCLARYGSSMRIYSVKTVPGSDKVVMRTDAGLTVFDLFVGRVVRQFPTLPGLPFVDVSKDGRRIVTGEGHGAAVYTLDGERKGHMTVPSARVLMARFNGDGNALVVGTSRGEIQLIVQESASC